MIPLIEVLESQIDDRLKDVYLDWKDDPTFDLEDAWIKKNKQEQMGFPVEDLANLAIALQQAHDYVYLREEEKKYRALRSAIKAMID